MWGDAKGLTPQIKTNYATTALFPPITIQAASFHRSTTESPTAFNVTVEPPSKAGGVSTTVPEFDSAM